MTKTITLSSREKVPVLGLGTYKLGARAEDAVLEALSIGYRHIDTAKLYENEAEVGRAIAKSGIPREEIFLTTKLWPSDQGYDKSLAAIDESLRKLGQKYVDLYLVHWPVDSAQVRKQTWNAMEEIFKTGKAKSIGVSNYDEVLLEELAGHATIPPAMNQIEVNPFVYDRKLVTYCHERGIAVTNYKPLMRTHELMHPAIVSLARMHGKTPAQVLLRWGILLGNIVIPKAAKTEHLKENFEIFDFELSAHDMERLGELGRA